MDKAFSFTHKRFAINATSAMRRERLYYDKHSRSEAGDKERQPFRMVHGQEERFRRTNTPSYKTAPAAFHSIGHRVNIGKLMDIGGETAVSKPSVDNSAFPQTDTVNNDTGMGRPAKVKLTEREMGIETAFGEPRAPSRDGDELNSVSRDSSELRSDVSSDVISEIDRITCMVCDDPGYYSKMVLCDACFNGCHTFCMRPRRLSVPLGYWLCPECHIVAQRHRIHLSRIIALKSQGGCLVCADKGQVKGSAEKQCVDCKLNFHRECLLTKRKLKIEQVDNPQWKCQVCVRYETENVFPKERKEKRDAAGQCHACSGFAVLRGVFDIVCAVCQLRFHRSCLQRLRKYTTEQLDDPRWTCVVCSMLGGQGKDSDKQRRPFSAPEPPQKKKIALGASSSVNGDGPREVKQQQPQLSQSRADALLPTQASRSRLFETGPSRPFQPPRANRANRAANAIPPFHGRIFRPDPGFRFVEATCEEDVVLDGSDMAEEGSIENESEPYRLESLNAAKFAKGYGRSKASFDLGYTGKRSGDSTNVHDKGDSVRRTKSEALRITLHEKLSKLPLAQSRSARKNHSDLGQLFTEQNRKKDKRNDVEMLAVESYASKGERGVEKLKCDELDDSQTELRKKKRRNSIPRKYMATAARESFLNDGIPEKGEIRHGKVCQGSKSSEVDGACRKGIGIELDGTTNKKDELLDKGGLEKLDNDNGGGLEPDGNDAIVVGPDVACQDGAVQLGGNLHSRGGSTGLERRKIKENVEAAREVSMLRRSVVLEKGGGQQYKHGIGTSLERKGSAKGTVDSSKGQNVGVRNEMQHVKMARGANKGSNDEENEVLCVGAEPGMVENGGDKESEVVYVGTERRDVGTRTMNSEGVARQREFERWEAFTRASLRPPAYVRQEHLRCLLGEGQRENSYCLNAEWPCGGGAGRVQVPKKYKEVLRPYSTEVGTFHARNHRGERLEASGSNSKLTSKRGTKLDWWLKEFGATAEGLQKNDTQAMTEDIYARAAGILTHGTAPQDSTEDLQSISLPTPHAEKDGVIVDGSMSAATRMWILLNVEPSKRFEARMFVRMGSMSYFGDSVRVLYCRDGRQREIRAVAFSRLLCGSGRTDAVRLWWRENRRHFENGGDMSPPEAILQSPMGFRAWRR